MLANCGCSSAKQSAQSTKTVTTRIEDSGLDLSKYKTLPIKANKTYTLKSNWDLKGETFVLPEGVTIEAKGGVFENGTLIGNSTKLKTGEVIFDKVFIKGEWNAPEISTSMFADLSYANALRDVFALASSHIHNSIEIKEGDYIFEFVTNGESGIEPPSNTEVRLDGTLGIKPNEFKNYYILNIAGTNIHIYGNGRIIGDKDDHLCTSGEWGMGVNFANAQMSEVEGITVEDCWGDCMYIGSNSENISIHDCILKNGRRQGVSITSGNNIRISNLHISKVGGTSPEYAIEIEPNKNESVDNVHIENVIVEDCVGGFALAASKERNSIISHVTYKDCIVKNVTSKPAFNFMQTTDVEVSGCEIYDCGFRVPIRIANDCSNIDIHHNKIRQSYISILNTIDGVRFHHNETSSRRIYPKLRIGENHERVYDNKVSTSE